MPADKPDPIVELVHTGGRGAAAMAVEWIKEMRRRGFDGCSERAYRVEMPRLDPNEGSVAKALQDRCKRLFLEGRPQFAYVFPSHANEDRTDADLVHELGVQKIPIRPIGWKEGVKRDGGWCQQPEKKPACKQQCVECRFPPPKKADEKVAE